MGREKEKTTLCDKKLSLTPQWLVSITRLCSSSEPREYFRPSALCLLVSCCAIYALRWAVSRQGGVGCARGVERRRQGAESAPESLCPPIPTRRREDDNSHHSYMYMYFRTPASPPVVRATHYCLENGKPHFGVQRDSTREGLPTSNTNEGTTVGCIN